MIVLAAFLMDQALLRLGDRTVVRIWPGGEGGRQDLRSGTVKSLKMWKQSRLWLLGF